MLAINQEQLELKTKINESIDNLWIKEVTKRKEEIESGGVVAVDGNEVFKKIQQRFDNK